MTRPAPWPQLAPNVFVSGQIPLEALADAAEAGVVRVINNRPDHEEPGQPTSAETAAAAAAAGLDYRHIPVRGLPDAAAFRAVTEALADGVPTLLYCRSGLRCAAAWALGRAEAGDQPDALRTAAAGAGYDLSRVPL